MREIYLSSQAQISTLIRVVKSIGSCVKKRTSSCELIFYNLSQPSTTINKKKNDIDFTNVLKN